MRLTLFLILLIPTLAQAETHTVNMLTRAGSEAMVYQPDHLTIAPGDSVHFVATQRGHNAAAIKSMLPAGAERFIGGIDEEITVTLDEPGVYGVKCSPHYAMGMVMLIEVGDAHASAGELPDDLPNRARQRFESILATD
ncbi:pseudoazurin [Marinobacter sp. JSM 1782161]|uniref:pseudoazurin n=1 Tax=Marinobacter sp. JSM 1782161 TaxID=2685906 RepID=UPI001401F31D|nr:pseudoazurin [Marinobacter sp. JSM 1782161]